MKKLLYNILGIWSSKYRLKYQQIRLDEINERRKKLVPVLDDLQEKLEIVKPAIKYTRGNWRGTNKNHRKIR